MLNANCEGCISVLCGGEPDADAPDVAVLERRRRGRVGKSGVIVELGLRSRR